MHVGILVEKLIAEIVCPGADKFLARSDWKKQLKGHNFSTDAEVIADAETWFDGQTSEIFLSGLQKLEFGRCSFFSFLLGLRTYQHPSNC